MSNILWNQFDVKGQVLLPFSPYVLEKAELAMSLLKSIGQVLLNPYCILWHGFCLWLEEFKTFMV